MVKHKRPAGHTQPSQSSRLQHTLRALRHRNYRLFFMGQGLSLIGTWMSQVATGWLVYRLTESALLLGLVGFSGQIPAFLLTPFAGVWADRWSRHKVLKVTQTLSMLQSFALAYLALSDRIHIAHVIVLAMFQGVVNAFDMPTRQSFVVEMLEDRADLPNAIALNSSIVNGARLVGPSIAGLIIAAAGEGYCFLIDGFSYLAVLGSLFRMTLRRTRIERSRRNVFWELREGLSYVRNFAPIRNILLLVAFTSLAGAPYSVLLPIFASEVLHGGANTLGFLTAAAGLGAFLSALRLAMRRTILGLGRVIAVTAFLFGLALAFFSLSHTLWISMALMSTVGFCLMQHLAASNTIMQTIVAEDKRGRVMSFYTMAFIGVTPFGSLIAGTLASRFGAPVTVAAGGLVCMGVGSWFALQLKKVRPIVRPIYQELGILPEVAKGIQAAADLQTPPEQAD
ncbi:MAG TPA: MFS transporter [Terriglobia bacterium]|nr:MFS transporter [Terriglobia bacterium]